MSVERRVAAVSSHLRVPVDSCHPLRSTAAASTGTFAAKIGGSVAPGYEAVKDAFAANFEKGLERDSQLCIYHKGERVVDIWGSSTEDGVSTAPPEGYNGDTLQIVFSSTKACAAVVFAVAVDRGLFTYDTKVATVWPEFAQEGAWAYFISASTDPNLPAHVNVEFVL